MRFTPRGRRGRREAQLNITPLIDVVFLLLVFFLLTTTFLDPESALTPLVRTSDESAQASLLQPQIVRVDAVAGVPTFAIGDLRLRDQQRLREALARLPVGPGLFIHVTDRVSVDFAVAALQAAKDAGFEKVTYVPVD
jgi:biopolymer transport protein ExbD